MEQTNQIYLSRLPDELKLKIFSYLDIFDIVQLCEILDVDHMTFDSSLIKILCLYKDYRCDLPFWNTFILNKTRSELITSLNINCIYWIPPYHIRTGLRQMPMLQHLYAVDTNLSLTGMDCVVYNVIPHLQSLAVFVSDEHLGLLPPGLINLYLHVDIQKSERILLLSDRLHKLPKLKDLWLIDMSSVAAQISIMRILHSIRSNVENVTILCQRPTDIPHISSLNLNRKLTFKSVSDNCVTMCFERRDLINDIYKKWDFKDISWDIFINRLKYFLPFGKEEAKKMINGKSPLEIKHEELNVVHPTDLCSHLFKTTVGAILLSENTKQLKKLAINICLADQSCDAVQPDSKVNSLFEKPRISVATSSLKKSKLEDVVLHSPLIEELELYDCGSINQDARTMKVTNAALSSVENLKYLKKLTVVGIPQHIDGQFLITICKSCKHLSSLRITASAENGSYHNNICLALPYATALKDFRYEFSYGSIDRIIEAFNKMTNYTLERLVLRNIIPPVFNCDSSFSLFLRNNPQLKFLCISLREATHELLRLIAKTAKIYKKRPDQVFVITRYEDALKGRLPVPHIHKKEMLEHHSNVSVLDIFNDFAKH